MAKDRQGLYFSELVWESTEQNIAIPPRQADKPEKPISPAAKPKKKSADAIQIQLWDMDEQQEPVTTTESQFAARARELADHKEPAALFVPFKSYWPTYGHMTGAQSRWYFFWRDEVRQGRYPKTDLSYIFLHVYELINGVGWIQPQDGYRQLALIWEASVTSTSGSTNISAAGLRTLPLSISWRSRCRTSLRVPGDLPVISPRSN